MISLSNKLTVTVLFSTLMIAGIGVALAAADEHAGHHPAADVIATTTSAPTPAAAPADAMANMKKMQGQMAAIRAAKDPKERTKLMDEHLQTMQSTLQMMQQDKGCMMGGDMMKGGESGGGMKMMPMMMEQMMQHQKAMQGSDK